MNFTFWIRNRKMVIENPVKRVAMSIVDMLGFWLYKLLAFFGYKRAQKIHLGYFSPRKILVIRLDHIGDVLISTSYFKALRIKFPKALIYALVGSWGKQVLVHNRNVDKLVIYDTPWFNNERPGNWRKSLLNINVIKDLLKIVSDLRKESFDLVIDPRSDFRHIFFFGYLARAKHFLCFNRTGGSYLLSEAVPFNESINEMDKIAELLLPLGITNVDRIVQVALSENEERIADNFIEKNGLRDRTVVLMSPGSRLRMKMWPIDRFIHLTGLLLEKHSSVVTVFVGAKSDLFLADALNTVFNEEKRVYNLIGKTSILDVFALMKKSHLIVTNDGPVSHMASAVDIATLVLFGPTSVERYRPYGRHIHCIKKKYECSPCLLNSCKHSGNNHDAYCMNAITVADVYPLVVKNLKLIGEDSLVKRKGVAK